MSLSQEFSFIISKQLAWRGMLRHLSDLTLFLK